MGKGPFKNQQYYQQIIEASLGGIIVVDADGKILLVNKIVEGMFGYSREEFLNMNVEQLVPERFRAKHPEYRAMFHKDPKVRSLGVGRDLFGLRKDGGEVPVEIGLNPIEAESGKIVLASIVDITERKIAEGKIQLEKRKLEEVLDLEQGLNTIFDANKLFDFIVEKTANILEADRCSLMLIDKHTDNLVVKGCRGLEKSFVIADHSINENFIARFVWIQCTPVLVKDIEVDPRFSRKNRLSYKGKSFICTPIKLGDDIIGVINVADKNSGADIFSEIDLKIIIMIAHHVAIAIENASLYKELNYLTITDPLTSMYNFRHFAKSLDREIERIKRHEGNLCLFLIDVDDFKSYNDTFGHLAGDLLLKSISEVFKDGLRKIDIACRYAGDEFVVILLETNISQAKIVAKKIIQAVGQLSLKRPVTISIGIAACKKNMDRSDLVQKADVALYKAKKNGKNKVYVLK